MPKEIPVLIVEGKTLAEGWERSMVELYRYGLDIKTQYDNPNDPPSKDCTMNLTIHQPLKDPMIHLSFPGGVEDLQEYVMEVCDGIKDHLTRDPDDPEDTRWEYTYHQRLFAYTYTDVEPPSLMHDNEQWAESSMNKTINQFEEVCQSLAKFFYTRRAQMITWKPWEDLHCYDPACLQSFWFRIVEDDNGVGYLNTNVRIRSNDAYKAAFMNIFAFIFLAKKVADRVAELSGRKVVVGRYNHQADSYHIYGKDLEEFRNRFMNSLEARTFAERVWNYKDVKEIMDEAIPNIHAKVKQMTEAREKKDA